MATVYRDPDSGRFVSYESAFERDIPASQIHYAYEDKPAESEDEKFIKGRESELDDIEGFDDSFEFDDYDIDESEY